MKKRKKIITIIGSFVLILALSLGIVACANFDKNGGDKVASSKDVYALSAVAGASYLTHLDGDSTNVAKNDASIKNVVSLASDETANTRPSEYTDESIDDIKNCLAMFDTTLSGGISHTVDKNEETDGEFAEYNFVMTITLKDVTAKVYYNELYTETETEIDEEDGTEEFEESTYLTGVIVYENEIFNVSGKREVENEDGESEYTIEFITKKDDKNYVKVSYGIENEKTEVETSYEYEIVVNGKKVTKTELSIEEKNGKIEIEFEIKSREGGDKNKTEYKIVKKDGSDNFEIKAEFNGRKSYITAEKVETGYVFTYSNGYKETLAFAS